MLKNAALVVFFLRHHVVFLFSMVVLDVAGVHSGSDDEFRMFFLAMCHLLQMCL